MSRTKRTKTMTALAAALCIVSFAAGGALADVPPPTNDMPDPGQAAHGQAAHGEDAHGGHGGVHVPDAPHINWFDHSWRDKNDHGGKMGSGLDASGKQYTAPGTDHEMPAPFIWVIINFSVAFLLLAWKAGPPLRRYLESRHLSVRESLEEAAKLRKQAQEKLDEYTARIADVEKEVEALIADIRSDAEAEKKRILADAETQAAKLKKDADDRIASEIVRARLELEREVVLASVNAAEKILREKATAGDKQTLVNDFITSFEQSQERA